MTNYYKCLKCREVSSGEEWDEYSKERNKYAVRHGQYVSIDRVFNEGVEDVGFKFNCPKNNCISYTYIKYGLNRESTHIEKIYKIEEWSE